MTMTAEPETKGVKSAERTLRILELLGAAAKYVPVVELHRLTGYPRSSLHHLLHTLAAARWIEMSDDGTQVAISTQALVVGASYLERDRTIPFAAAALEQIRDDTGYTAHYARLDGSSVLYLATREPSNSHRRVSRIGRKLPAHATSHGKALLAQLTPLERDAVLGDTPLQALTTRTITDRQALDDQLLHIRSRGFSVEYGENTEGIVCVGVHVQYRIPATDAISCSIPEDLATEAELARVSKILLRGSRDLADALQAQGVR